MYVLKLKPSLIFYGIYTKSLRLYCPSFNCAEIGLSFSINPFFFWGDALAPSSSCSSFISHLPQQWQSSLLCVVCWLLLVQQHQKHFNIIYTVTWSNLFVFTKTFISTLNNLSWSRGKVDLVTPGLSEHLLYVPQTATCAQEWCKSCRYINGLLAVDCRAMCWIEKCLRNTLTVASLGIQLTPILVC